MDSSGFGAGKINLNLPDCEWKRLPRERLQREKRGKLGLSFEEHQPMQHERESKILNRLKRGTQRGTRKTSKKWLTQKVKMRRIICGECC